MTKNTILSSRPIRGFFQQAGGRVEIRGTHKCPHWSLTSSTLIKTPLTSIFLPAFLPVAHSHLSWHLPVETRRMKSRPSLAFSSSTHLPLVPTRSPLTRHTYSRHLPYSRAFLLPPSLHSSLESVLLNPVQLST